MVSHRFIVNSCQLAHAAVVILTTWSLSAIGNPVNADIVDFTKQTSLKNALFIAQPKATDVQVDLLIDAGEYDNTGPAGLPHYLEHLVYWSTEKTPGNNIANHQSGARTSGAWTAYSSSGSATKTEDMLQRAARVFTQVELDSDYAISEREIVQREYDLRIIGSPARQLYERLYANMYRGHPFSQSTIGNRNSISQFTPALAVAFKERWYLANNASLVVSGPLSAQKVQSLFKRYFSNLPVGDIPEHSWKSTAVSPQSTRTAMTHRNLATPLLMHLVHTPAIAELDAIQQYVAVTMLTALMNSSQPASITKPLYYDDFLTISLTSACYLQADRSIALLVQAEPEDGIDNNELFAAIVNALDKMATSTEFNASFETIKKKQLQQLKREAESHNMRTAIVLNTLQKLGQPLSSDQLIKAFEAANAEHARLALNALLESETIGRGSIYPEK